MPSSDKAHLDLAHASGPRAGGRKKVGSRTLPPLLPKTKVWCPPHRPLVSLPLPWLHQPFTAKLAGERQDQVGEITQRPPGPFHTHGLYTYCVPGLGEPWGKFPSLGALCGSASFTIRVFQ